MFTCFDSNLYILLRRVEDGSRSEAMVNSSRLQKALPAQPCRARFPFPQLVGLVQLVGMLLVSLIKCSRCFFLYRRRAKSIRCVTDTLCLRPSAMSRIFPWRYQCMGFQFGPTVPDGLINLGLFEAGFVFRFAVALAVTDVLALFEEGRHSVKRPDRLLVLLLVPVLRLLIVGPYYTQGPGNQRG